MKKIEAVDLFCGVGGLTAGLIKSGITVKAGYDIEDTCRYPYENNNNAKFINKDIQSVTSEEITQHYSKNSIKLLAGCAPCQPFSKYNQGKDLQSDKKWPLLYYFAKLIKDIQPDLVTMENVPEVIKHQVYQDFTKNLEEQGYQIWQSIVSCIDYGIPQMRRRHVTLASKIGFIELIKPTHLENPMVLKDVIKHLPAIKSGEACLNDNLHFSSKLSALNIKRIQASIPGGTWRDWPEDLKLACHKKSTGATYGAVYGRMEWNKPAPTMTTQCYGYGNGRFGHPEQDRAISLREAAIIQTFPDSYIFTENKKFSTRIVGRMIGNAVPVRLGEVIGLSFLNYLNKS